MASVRDFLESVGPHFDKLIDLGSVVRRFRKIFADDIALRTGTVTQAPSATTDITNKAYVDSLALGAAGITVEEVDGAPSELLTTTLRFDQADGFVVSSPGAGIARVDITAIPSANLATVAVAQGGTGLTASPITVPLGGTGVTTLATGYVKSADAAAFTSQAVPIPVADGGTNAITAAAARTSLGAATQLSPVTLTDGATVAVDASLGDYFKLSTTQSFTLSNPTNPTNGQRIMFRILQDAGGGRVITLDTKYRLGTDIATVVLTVTGSKTDYIGCVYDSVADKWDVVAFAKGY